MIEMNISLNGLFNDSMFVFDKDWNCNLQEHVYSNSAIVEYVLNRFVLPKFYFKAIIINEKIEYCSLSNNIKILNTLKSFMDNKFKLFHLQTFANELTGFDFLSLPISKQRIIKETYVNICVCNFDTTPSELTLINHCLLFC